MSRWKAEIILFAPSMSESKTATAFIADVLLRPADLSFRYEWNLMKSRRSGLMKNITDSADENEVGDIIIAAWRTGKTPGKIAEEMRIPIKDVYKSLKKSQKALIKGWS
jgi:hypothetical protein